MSDYLSRAAGRASRTGGAIRPLLPFRFDLEKSADTTALTSPEIEEHLQTESPRRERERTADEITAPEEKMIPTATIRAAASMLTGESTPPAKQPPVAAIPPERGAPSAQSQTVSKKPASRESASREPAVDRAQTDQSQPVTEPDVESPPAPAPPQVEVHPPVLERTKKDLPTPIIVAPVARRRDASVRPAAAQHSAASADRRLPAAPKIQVTIGRLEVRAVQSAPAPPKPVPPSPRISLDEYLRSRNGGAA